MKPLDPRLLRYARASRRYLAATVGLGVLSAVLIVGQATLLAYGTSRVFLEHAMVTSTLVALAGVVVARAGVAWAQEIVSARSAAAVKRELRGQIFERVAELGPGRAAGPATGEVTALATRGLDDLDAYFAKYLPQLVLAAVVPVVVLARLLPADLIATATIALTLPLIPIFMALVGMHTNAANARQFKLLARLNHHFLDVVAGLSTLKIFGRAGAQVANIRRAGAEQRRVTMGTLRIAFLSSLVLELLATLSVALVAVGIGLRLVSGHLTLPTALLVLILAPEAYLPLRQVGVHFHASAAGVAAAAAAFEVLETPVPPAGAAAPPFGARKIVFEDVVVRHRGSDAVRLSLSVPPGGFVALTGPSGCGKSTALNLLLGFARCDAGRVTVGGVDLSTLDPASWRSRIAWVPQRPYLFAGSIRSNIALGAPDPAPDVEFAARQAGCDFITDFDAELGDNGAGLSAGQRQRIALARAFLRDASIVLLDEPTANLDAETAATVMEAIRRLAAGRTVIMAAHRPELIALAGTVVDLTPVGAP